MIRRFTGWHMAAIIVGFFGIVIAVNLTMATLALRTFGGTVVDNSYVASQRFNRWLAEARAQQALGWRAGPLTTANGRVRLAIDVRGQPLTGAVVTGIAEHPVGRAPEESLTFATAGDGVYVARQALPPGRWVVRLTVARGREEARFLRMVAP